MALEFTHMLAAQSIKESGLRTNSKDKAPKYGPTALATQAIFTTDSSQDTERLLIQMEVVTKVSLCKVSLTEQAPIDGQMDENTLGNGRILRCTAEVS